MSDLRHAGSPHVVIVGGGFAGLAAARALGKKDVRVTLVDRANHHLFQPLLYQIAMAGLSPAEIAYPIRTALRKQKNAQVLLGEIANIDLDSQRVKFSDGGELVYDYLILATGAETNFFGHDQDWAKYSVPMKTIDDAIEVRRRVLLAFEAAEREPDPAARRRLLTFAVIGGGPTGVEVAGALAELAKFVLAEDFRVTHPEQSRVVLIEMMDRLLPGGFDADLAQKARTQLEELGVEVRTSTRVLAIDERGVALENERIESAAVLWTAGVKAGRVTSTLGVPCDKAGRVIVDPDCSIPGHPNAFVIGDAAHWEHGGPPLPGVAPVAMQQGRYVASVINDRLHRHTPPPFRYRDKGIMATIGRSRAVAQSGKLRLTGLMAWLAWLVVHVIYLVGFRNRVAVLLNWFWSYVTYRRGARLITGGRAWEDLPRLMAWSERSLPEAPSRPRSAPVHEPSHAGAE